jgi:hypothetical protein
MIETTPPLLTDSEARSRLAAPLGSNDDARTIKRRLIDAVGAWRVDPMVSSIPWHADVTDPLDNEQKAVAVRLAVLRAWEAGRAAESRRRGRREAALLVRRGDPLFDDQCLPHLVAKPEQDSPRGLMLRLAADAAAIRLGIELGGGTDAADRLREAASGERHQGRAAAEEVPAFIRSLANWWWRATGRRPERQENAARSSGGRLTFLRFAVAAITDMSPTGNAMPPGFISAIRRVVDEMEKDGTARWP